MNNSERNVKEQIIKFVGVYYQSYTKDIYQPYIFGEIGYDDSSSNRIVLNNKPNKPNMLSLQVKQLVLLLWEALQCRIFRAHARIYPKENIVHPCTVFWLDYIARVRAHRYNGAEPAVDSNQWSLFLQGGKAEWQSARSRVTVRTECAQIVLN